MLDDLHVTKRGLNARGGPPLLTAKFWHTPSMRAPSDRIGSMQAASSPPRRGDPDLPLCAMWLRLFDALTRFKGVAEPTLLIGGLTFALVAALDPDRDSDGRPVEFMPQAAYAKAGTSRLNPHGAGPFCRLRVVPRLHQAGLYAVVVGSDVRYIGIADDLAERWGPRGYGVIHPRNCYVGGQPTNCKINSAILREVHAERRPLLYFCALPANRRAHEARLIGELHPPWNGRTPDPVQRRSHAVSTIAERA